MSHLVKIKVLADPSALAEAACTEFIRLAKETLKSGDRFTVVLAGGNTPREMYSRLVAVPSEWEHIHFFWSDERSVPPDHADSNFRMAKETLLNSISVPAENIHRIQGELSAEAAAINYEAELRRFFYGKTPHFDLVILGLGEDGHVASIFPNSSTIQENKRWVVAVKHDVPPTPLVDRVTLTLPLLNDAAHVLFLVSGEAKAGRLAEVVGGPFHPEVLPAQAVIPVYGDILWMVDQTAAAKLPQRMKIN